MEEGRYYGRLAVAISMMLLPLVAAVARFLVADLTP